MYPAEPRLKLVGPVYAGSELFTNWVVVVSG